MRDHAGTALKSIAEPRLWGRNDVMWNGPLRIGVHRVWSTDGMFSRLVIGVQRVWVLRNHTTCLTRGHKNLLVPEGIELQGQ